MIELGDKMDQIIKTIGFLALSMIAIKRNKRNEKMRGFHTDLVPGDNFPYVVMTRSQISSDSKQ